MELVTGTPTTDVDRLLDALDEVATAHDVATQAFDARYVADRAHLARAVELADRERARGEGIARDRAVEVLLYAAGRRQIDRALKMGARQGDPAVVLLAAETDESGEPSEPGGTDETDGPEPTARTERAAAEAVRDLDSFDAGPVALGDAATLRSFFHVSEAELAAADGDLAGLVRERVALLVVER